MKTIKSAIATLISIATLTTAAISTAACSTTADEDIISVPKYTPIQELDPVSIAEFMDNPYPNSFCGFRITMNDTACVLLNTADNSVIGIYESPTDEVSELALYENLYNDMWNLR